MRQCLLLFRNYLRLEARLGETLILMVLLSVIVSVILSVGVSSSFLDGASKQKLFPALIWVVFVVCATVSIGRSYEYELEHRALDGLLVNGVSPITIFLSKSLISVMLLVIAQGVSICTLGVLMNVEFFSDALSIGVISILVILAYAPLATLLSAIAMTSRLRQVLLPLILIPLIFPLFFAAVELTASVTHSHTLDLSSAWLSLLIGLDVVYLTLGINLFEYVIRE